MVAGFLASAGHCALDPVQNSAASQNAAAARHGVPAFARTSGGQSLRTPSQDSAPSQSPPDGRHTAVLFASAGHVPLDPVQVSTMSQTPAEGRQTVVAGWKVHDDEQ